MRNFRNKYFQFCANYAKKIAQNRAKLIAFHAQKIAQKFAKKKFAQILRKRFSHFVETLVAMAKNKCSVFLKFTCSGLQKISSGGNIKHLAYAE